MSAIAAAALYATCAAADLGSTSIAQAHGGVELQPWLADTDGRIRWDRAVAAKVASTAALVVIDSAIARRSKPAAWWFRGAVVAIHIWVVSHNLRVRGGSR